MNGLPVVENFVDFDSKTVPSDDLLAKCFLSKFLEDENKYRCKIQSANTGISISFDHTFKVASNLDSFLEMENGLINMIVLFLSSILMGKFCHGQFTRGTSFVQVKKLLNLIHQRAVQK